MKVLIYIHLTKWIAFVVNPLLGLRNTFTNLAAEPFDITTHHLPSLTVKALNLPQHLLIREHVNELLEYRVVLVFLIFPIWEEFLRQLHMNW